MTTVEREREILVREISRAPGYSNSFDALTVGELIRKTNGRLRSADGYDFRVGPLLIADEGSWFSSLAINGHRSHARGRRLASPFYNMTFPLRRFTWPLDWLAMRNTRARLSAHGAEENTGLLFFQQDAANVVYGANHDLPIVLYVANAEAFGKAQYRPYRGGLVGPHRPTLEKIRGMVNIDPGLVTVVDDIMPVGLARHYQEDNRRRVKFFEQPVGPLKICYLPSGSGTDLGYLERLIAPIGSLLKKGMVQLTVGLFTNRDQLTSRGGLFSRPGIRTIWSSDRRAAYEETTEAVRKCHLLITIANSYTRSFAGGLLIFLDTHVAGRIEAANLPHASQYPGVVVGEPDKLLAGLFADGYEAAIEELRRRYEQLGLVRAEEDPVHPLIKNWRSARKIRDHLIRVAAMGGNASGSPAEKPA